MSNEGARSLIDDVLPDYEAISKAPTLVDLIRRATNIGVDLDVVLERERDRKYKSLDTATGAIYLIQNPACWLNLGDRYVRPKPEYQCSLTDARKYGGQSPKKVGNASDAF
jgi:hypothetical protein